MTQRIYTGTSGNDLIDGSALAAGDYMVFRSLGGSDTVIGSAGNDRFQLGTAGDSIFGGGGRDQFFVSIGNRPNAVRDSIDGGSGSDELIITLNSNQLTNTLKAELLRLDNFTILHGGDSSAHFTSDILHLDMSGVENARVRLDGTMTTLDAITPRIANGGFEASPDLTGWHLTNKIDPQYDAYSWYGVVDRSGSGATDGTASAALGFDGSSWDVGYTGTGPSIVTDAAFSARAGEHITFDFVLMASGDTAIVHADLIDATTGAVVQQLFRQEQGESDYWYNGPYAGSATAANSAAIAATGSYKLAIALDSFDSTYGGYIGAALHVDHVVIA